MCVRPNMRLRGRTLDTMVRRQRLSSSGSGDITWHTVISRRGCLLNPCLRLMAMLSAFQLFTSAMKAEFVKFAAHQRPKHLGRGVSRAGGMSFEARVAEAETFQFRMRRVFSLSSLIQMPLIRVLHFVAAIPFRTSWGLSVPCQFAMKLAAVAHLSQKPVLCTNSRLPSHPIPNRVSQPHAAFTMSQLLIKPIPGHFPIQNFQANSCAPRRCTIPKQKLTSP
ncbi:hypothetical protein BKA64DRAFT_667115 [Cadophora sp. MPI-SDFR-AT-0126]|nr:hypothetical protein BKA64DRAFT_667115 [Leotiomycetes sp. MPI-SDFR-AT-0126]